MINKESSHARLGPSNHRWPHCAGSIEAESFYPDTAGDAAIDGTGTHLLLELILNKWNAKRDEFKLAGKDVARRLSQEYLAETIYEVDTEFPEKPLGWVVHQDRIDRVNVCLDYVAMRLEQLHAEYPDANVVFSSEQRMDPGGMFGRSDWWGTCDITINVNAVVTNKPLFIETIDYKDGRGYVHVPGNTQLLSYLGGAMREKTLLHPGKWINYECPDGGRYTIVQPKTKKAIRYENISIEDLAVELIKLNVAAEATDDPNAKRTPDDRGGKGWCTWCKAKKNCTAASERDIEIMKNMENNIIATDNKSLFELVGDSIDDVATLESSKLSELADAEAGILAIFASVKAEIKKRVEDGQHVSGFAMKPGKSKRVWSIAEADVAKKLRGRKLKDADIYPKKMISPAQMEKCKGLTKVQIEKLLSECVTTIDGALTLTRVERTDDTAITSMFDGVTHTEQKDVVQSSTTVIQSNPTPSLFDEPVTPNIINFL